MKPSETVSRVPSAKTPARRPRHRSPTDTSQRILAAATEGFLRNGYANTNLEQVAVSAGVTKPTIYSHFGSKAQLLKAVTDANAGEPLTALLSVLYSSGDPRTDLQRFGTQFLLTVFSSRARLWDRLAAAEAHDHPELGAAIFESGPARVTEALANYLTGEKRAGRLSIDDAASAAEQFIGLLLGLDLLRAQVAKPLPSATDREHRCKGAVAVFLAAYGGSNE